MGRSPNPGRENGRGNGCGRGRGNGGRGQGRGKGGGSTPRPSSTKTEGMCSDLKGYIFDCGERGSAEQAQKTMERIALYCGKHMNMDISKELTNRARLVIPEPEYPPEALEMQEKEKIMKTNKLTRLMEVWEPKIEALTDRKDQLTLEEQMELAKLLNEAEEAAFEAARPVKVKLTEAQKKINDGK